MYRTSLAFWWHDHGNYSLPSLGFENHVFCFLPTRPRRSEVNRRQTHPVAHPPTPYGCLLEISMLSNGMAGRLVSWATCIMAKPWLLGWCLPIGSLDIVGVEKETLHMHGTLDTDSYHIARHRCSAAKNVRNQVLSNLDFDQFYCCAWTDCESRVRNCYLDSENTYSAAFNQEALFLGPLFIGRYIVMSFLSIGPTIFKASF